MIDSFIVSFLLYKFFSFTDSFAGKRGIFLWFFVYSGVVYVAIPFLEIIYFIVILMDYGEL